MIVPQKWSYLCQPRKIHQGKTENIWGIDLEVDGLPVDALVAPSNACSFSFDLPLDLTEFIPSPTRDMMKLSPFLRCGRFSIDGYVDELKNEWTAGDNTTAARKEISTDNVF
jgi:hypothetical protein